MPSIPNIITEGIPAIAAAASPAVDSIAFVVTEYRPGSCGVFDYAVRMAAGMQALGLRAMVLCTAGETPPASIRSGDAKVGVRIFTPETADEFKVLAVQLVPSSYRSTIGFAKMIGATGHKRIHLMMHEMWRIPTMDFPLTAREKLRSILQRRMVHRFIKILGPATVSCSNQFYRKHLLGAGIPASLSPMPGNIPVGDGTDAPDAAADTCFFERTGEEFVWATFGSLYGSYWDPVVYFGKMREAQSGFPRAFKWIVIGSQKSADVEAFAAAATANGFGGDIRFTGRADPETVDWILRNSDAAFSPLGRDFWEKSGGTLAAVERGLPVYFHRPAEDPRPCIEPGLYLDPGLLLREHRPRQNYDGPHSLQNACLRLLEILGQ